MLRRSYLVLTFDVGLIKKHKVQKITSIKMQNAVFILQLSVPQEVSMDSSYEECFW